MGGKNDVLKGEQTLWVQNQHGTQDSVYRKEHRSWAPLSPLLEQVWRPSFQLWVPGLLNKEGEGLARNTRALDGLDVNL
jgi:hypothetical protein